MKTILRTLALAGLASLLLATSGAVPVANAHTSCLPSPAAWCNHGDHGTAAVCAITVGCVKYCMGSGICGDAHCYRFISPGSDLVQVCSPLLP